MAYMRGEVYIWHGDDGFHFWAKDGYDNWDITGWAEDEHEKRHEGYENASGVCVPEDIVDAFVMMRLARLLYENKTDEPIDRVCRDFGGYFSSMILQRNVEKIKAALSAIAMEDIERDEAGYAV